MPVSESNFRAVFPGQTRQAHSQAHGDEKPWFFWLVRVLLRLAFVGVFSFRFEDKPVWIYPGKHPLACVRAASSDTESFGMQLREDFLPVVYVIDNLDFLNNCA